MGAIHVLHRVTSMCYIDQLPLYSCISLMSFSSPICVFCTFVFLCLDRAQTEGGNGRHMLQGAGEPWWTPAAKGANNWSMLLDLASAHLYKSSHLTQWRKTKPKHTLVEKCDQGYMDGVDHPTQSATWMEAAKSTNKWSTATTSLAHFRQLLKRNHSSHLREAS